VKLQRRKPKDPEHSYQSVQQEIKDCSLSDEQTGCWVWQASERDYPSLKRLGQQQAHRVSWAAFNEMDIPPLFFQVRHTCHNKRCVNPEHLALGTMWHNVHDNLVSGSGTAKLSLEDREQVRKQFYEGTSKKRLMEIYKVSMTIINAAINREEDAVILRAQLKWTIHPDGDVTFHLGKLKCVPTSFHGKAEEKRQIAESKRPPKGADKHGSGTLQKYETKSGTRWRAFGRGKGRLKSLGSFISEALAIKACQEFYGDLWIDPAKRASIRPGSPKG
jgi:hypothetical protein